MKGVEISQEAANKAVNLITFAFCNCKQNIVAIEKKEGIGNMIRVYSVLSSFPISTASSKYQLRINFSKAMVSFIINICKHLGDWSIIHSMTQERR